MKHGHIWLTFLIAFANSFACKARKAESSNVKTDDDILAKRIVIDLKSSVAVAIQTCDARKIKAASSADSFSLNSKLVVDEKGEPYRILNKVADCFFEKKLSKKDFVDILQLLKTKRVMISEVEDAKGRASSFLFTIVDSDLMNVEIVSTVLSSIDNDLDRRRYLTYGAHDGQIVDYVFFRFNLNVLKVLQKFGAPTSECGENNSNGVLGIERSRTKWQEVKKIHLEHIHFNIVRLKNKGAKVEGEQNGDPAVIQSEIETMPQPVSEDLQVYIRLFQKVSDNNLGQQLIEVYAKVACTDLSILSNKDSLKDLFGDSEDR